MLSDQILEEYLPADKLQEVKRILNGYNMGSAVKPLPIPKNVEVQANEGRFEVKAFQFGALPEQLRKPRIVRIGLVQHGMVKPTTAPIHEQVHP